jgi:hypothetical protein
MAKTSRPIILLLATGAAVAALPAAAQFGSIFREEPPRPPADIPDGRPPPNSFPPPTGFPPRDLPPMPRQDFPPTVHRAPSSEPPPVSGNPPPAGTQRGSPIQSQPLPPPPGGTAAPAQTARPQQPAAPQPSQQVPQPSQQQAAPATQTTLPPTEVVVAPPPQRIANPTAVFAGLDKITGRITSFDVAIDETVQFGALRVTPRVCYSRPPTESPRTDAFIDVDEVTLQGEIRRIFTGWMFVSSPGLHAVEHPIYDIWLTKCKGGALALAGSEDARDEAEKKQPGASAQGRR